MNEFMGFASDSSLDKAAKKYDVREEIEILREIACESEKANLSLHQLLGGSRLLQLMKKLGLEPLQLEDTINVFEKHKEKFGNFIESALTLGNLEAETGKSYSQLITEYEKTKQKLVRLSEEIKNAKLDSSREQETAKQKLDLLNKEIQTRKAEVEDLEKRAEKAQTKIADFKKTQQELYNYGIGFKDYSTVRDFLNEIKSLNGNPSQAVAIIEDCGSLHKKREQLKTDINAIKAQHKEEEARHQVAIRILQKEKQTLENEITKKEERNGFLRTENKQLMETIKKRQEYRHALELQVDGLLNTQAEMLQVQPDIDEVHQALPKRKQELEDLNKQIEPKKTILQIAVALENLLQKHPADRNTLIFWLNKGGISNIYQPTDEKVRQKITQLLAQDGYIPRLELEKAQADMKQKIEAAEKQTTFWVKRANKKSEALIECQDLLKEATGRLDKQKNDEFIKNVSSFLVSLSEKI